MARAFRSRMPPSSRLGSRRPRTTSEGVSQRVLRVRAAGQDPPASVRRRILRAREPGAARRFGKGGAGEQQGVDSGRYRASGLCTSLPPMTLRGSGGARRPTPGASLRCNAASSLASRESAPPGTLGPPRRPAAGSDREARANGIAYFFAGSSRPRGALARVPWDALARVPGGDGRWRGQGPAEPDSGMRYAWTGTLDVRCGRGAAAQCEGLSLDPPRSGIGSVRA